MEKEPLVTIGVPVYNVEAYIEECIGSILKQTFQSLEVLFVDDCGKDQSIRIIADIIDKHHAASWMKIIHHPQNKGVAEARNTILNEAKGKYIYFMDADDYITPDAIKKLYDKAESINAETTWGSFIQLNSVTKEILPSISYPGIALLGKGKLAEYNYQSYHEKLQQAIWNILFRTDFLKGHHFRFEQLCSFEDGIFQATIQPHVERAVLMSDVTYYYVHRPESLTTKSTFQTKDAINIFKAYACHKRLCQTILSDNYFECRCTHVMWESYYAALTIIRRKNSDCQITMDEIKRLLSHPATFRQILKFKRYRWMNLYYYFLGKMPTKCFSAIIHLTVHKNR